MQPGEEQQQTPENAKLRELKHDIKNELSGMILCMEQLKYEMSDPSADMQYYIDSISSGFVNINKILNSVD